MEGKISKNWEKNQNKMGKNWENIGGKKEEKQE